MENQLELNAEEIRILEEIYRDIYADYKVRVVSSNVLNVEDPNLIKLKRQIGVMEKLLFLRSPHA